MIESFRLRLALLSGLLSGVALSAFSAGAWWLIRDIKLDRIDHEVRTHAEREVSRMRSPEGWQRTVESIGNSLGIRDASQISLLVEDSHRQTTYRSRAWPSGLEAATFPWPVPPERPPGSRPRPRPGAADNFLSKGPDDDFRREPPPPGPPPASAAFSARANGHLWRIGLASSERARVALVADASSIDAEMSAIRNAFLFAIPPALLLIGFGSWLFSARAMRPLRKLTAATQRISAEKLDQRIPEQGEDREFVALIDVFNKMLERLEASFNQAHRFSADAAHELRTPLAILQGQLERAIGKAQAGSAMQVELSSILDEVRRLSTITRKLLLLSQADAGRLNVHREPFDLSQALEEMIEDMQMLAPQLRITSKVQPGLIVWADGSLLGQVLHNLISNAIKYNIESGWVHIAATAAHEWAQVMVANSSHGIAIADQKRLFERFFRADPSRSRNVDGIGLGLSVSREIARAHGGDITFKPGIEGAVHFTLRLPLGMSKPWHHQAGVTRPND